MCENCRELRAEVKRLNKIGCVLLEALSMYANPEFYHGISFMADRPTGGFDGDMDRKHGHPLYDRAMPGKLARRAILRLQKLVKK